MTRVLAVVVAILVSLPAFLAAQVPANTIPCGNILNPFNCTNPIDVNETASVYDFASEQEAQDWANDQANVDAVAALILVGIYDSWDCLCVPDPSKGCPKWAFFEGDVNVQICGHGGSWQVDVEVIGEMTICCGTCITSSF